jgi:hypothetical protein
MCLGLWAMMSAMRRRQAARRLADDAGDPATMPEYLLYDIGMSRDGVPSLARQLRSDGEC